jgi:non-ribosomal peptide synthase protein (TIGR01720 family)
MPQAEAIFNHMGQFDQALDRSAPFAPARETSGPAHGLAGKRGHLLEINSGVTGGRLQVSWTFGEKIHRRATIERLAQSFIDELKAIISHCLAPDAGAYTPSDFPQVRLDQQKLNRALEAVKFGA